MADESTGTAEAIPEGGEDTKVEVEDVGESQTPETETDNEQGGKTEEVVDPMPTALADLADEALRALIHEIASDVALEALTGFGEDIDKTTKRMDEARQALLIEIRTGREASEAEVVAGAASIVDNLGKSVARTQSSVPELRAELVRSEQGLRREIEELREGMKYLNDELQLWKGTAQNLARILEARKVLQELQPQPAPTPTKTSASPVSAPTQPEPRSAPDLPDFLRDVR
ncbi:MAG: hypothetical protein CEN89_37 [Candidatus Berkelbacteria bacterium Licking1014_7]|uniref:Uncharacterized protein n=1 Tax=Candidatus Berkelbacteria bacterium Licking1014_7 TaxID=2017147 RepID=A0A554LKV0_9BACT|nr:MAG: hypothetical protein CEN89_37 [Candidatus Berkelbacteria bacterium Licking1014_7]